MTRLEQALEALREAALKLGWYLDHEYHFVRLDTAIRILTEWWPQESAPAPVKERDDVEWLAVDAMDGSTQRVADKALPVDDDRERLIREGMRERFVGEGRLWRTEDTAYLLSLLDAARAERDAARQDLADAANEINCSGPVAHRIRVLKEEHAAELAILRADRDDLVGKLSRQNDAYLAQSVEVARLRGERERLLEAVKAFLDSDAERYAAANRRDGWHSHSCEAVQDWRKSKPCNCVAGVLRKAIAAAETQAPKEAEK